MYTRVTYGDPRSNRSRDIRAGHFLMDDERTTTTPADADHHVSHIGVCLIMLNYGINPIPPIVAGN